MEKKEPKNDELRYSQACIDHREKLHMMELTEDSRKLDCRKDRFCYQEGCPIYKEEKIKGREGTMVKNEKSGETFIEKQPKRTPDNLLGLNLEVFEPLGGDEKKKEKKISKEIEDFLYLQSRVIGKLAWNPQIWKALDNLSSQDILERLLGKTGLEGVATHAGGDMALKASKKTQKLFANLEQQFAEEDEKKGKSSPPNFEDVDANKIKLSDFKPTEEDFNRALGLVPKDVPPLWAEKKGEKKDEKTTKK